MNNPILEHMKNHRSIRKYQDRPVDPKIINEILEAGISASTSGNMQPYSVIVTTDKEIREELYPHHFEQNMVLDAPVLLTFCADFHRMRRWLELRDAPLNFDNLMSFLIATIDTTLFSQNVALAAEAYGLGICYMGTTLASCDEIGKILNCPPNVVPVVGFSLGYPDEHPERRDRLPLSGVVHLQKYQLPSDQYILETYEDKETSGMERYRSYPELKAEMDEVGALNLAQVYTKAKYTRESHIGYSQTVAGYLEKQNFMNY